LDTLASTRIAPAGVAVKAVTSSMYFADVARSTANVGFFANVER
jgi:hypothetical protein